MIVEISGLAGAGKTSLVQTLSQKKNILVAPELRLRHPPHLRLFIENLRALRPYLMPKPDQERRFTWEEIKAVVYLRAWPRLLQRQVASECAVILLDHGPIFKLATLYEFGPSQLLQPAFDIWWQKMISDWATVLDTVIWLEAPLPVLTQRINGREQKHSVKNQPYAHATHFLKRYQHAYDSILNLFAATNSLRLFQFDSDHLSTTQLADQILRVIQPHPLETTSRL